MSVDYSLYLVTDSTKAILGGKDLVKVVDAAIEGGVTVVQLRDKTSGTADLIRIAKDVHIVTQKHGVPFLINDRVDVALAVGAEGVHIGQDDMDLATARELLGPRAIIGVTCSNISEAQAATIGGANYVGIGTMFTTPTKENTKSVIGTAGTRAILHHLSGMPERPESIAAVAIGGINASNVQRVLFQSKSTFKSLDGVAVVSAIVAAEDPKAAAAHLRELITTPPIFRSLLTLGAQVQKVQELVGRVPAVVKKVGMVAPICHNMTNMVVQNFAANVAVAIGASPIMANDGSEAEDLAGLKGALVINMGSATSQSISDYTQALKAYNESGAPVLFDPVGAGATRLRREAVRTLMASGFFTIIKGNESEIVVVLGESCVQQKGVDSGKSEKTAIDKARVVKKLAARERNVVVMTGVVDYISDGTRTYSISNGHPYLGLITGSGCTLGTTIAAFTAVEKEDRLLAVLAGTLMFEIAAQQAARQPGVNGPGTFVPAFVDALSSIARQAEADNTEWLKEAKVQSMETL
ncbi:hypothetical protein MMC19_007502 [Ptychographa xylographoides]|nr:hypothetical protein [Ptychographa xylographoides]